jgi:hypothetical protein
MGRQLAIQRIPEAESKTSRFGGRRPARKVPQRHQQVLEPEPSQI